MTFRSEQGGGHHNQAIVPSNARSNPTLLQYEGGMMSAAPVEVDRLTVMLLSGVRAIMFLGLVSVPAAGETYVRAVVDQAGQLRILTKDRREIVPKKEPEQVAFEKPAISPDGRAVGWLALYPNCCTSYPIPLKLVVYASGKLRTFTGIGLPIWRWCFQVGGKQVAFEQETVHGGIGVHYELRDVKTCRLIAKYDPDPNSVVFGAPPKWVAELDSRR